MKLSVSMVTFNQREFIGEAIESALSDLPENAELLIGDDNSSDGTADIVRDYAVRCPDRVRAFLGRERLGVAGNVNRNLSAAKGELIGFLGGDDIVLPGKFASQVAFLDANPGVGVCYHDVAVVFEDGSQSYLFSDRHRMRRGGVENILRYGSFFSANSAMIRRSLAPPGGLDTSIPYSSDTLFYARCLRNGASVDYVPGVYLRYRFHGTNVSWLFRQEIEREKRHELDLMEGFFPEYAACIRRHRSDLWFRTAVRRLRSGHLREGLRGLRHSISLSPGVWTAPRIAIDEVIWRIRKLWRGLRLCSFP